MGSNYPSPRALATPNVSNASVQVAAFNPPRLSLFVYNPSLTVTLWVSPLEVPAVVGGAGSVAIEPRQGKIFGPPSTPVWSNGMNAIADAAGTNAITIQEYYG